MDKMHFGIRIMSPGAPHYTMCKMYLHGNIRPVTENKDEVTCEECINEINKMLRAK